MGRTAYYDVNSGDVESLEVMAVAAAVSSKHLSNTRWNGPQDSKLFAVQELDPTVALHVLEHLPQSCKILNLYLPQHRCITVKAEVRQLGDEEMLPPASIFRSVNLVSRNQLR